jgi:hypothetical protein
MKQMMILKDKESRKQINGKFSNVDGADGNK